MLTDDGVELYVQESGVDGAPVTVVFVHGWALSSASWAAEAEALGRVARVIRYDQRGHGRSAGLPRSPAGIPRLAEDLYGLLDELVPAGPVVLVGHSMGGMTILALAGSHPELFGGRVAGVALVDTSASGLRGGTLDLSRPLGWIFRPLMALLMLFWRRLPRLADRIRRLLLSPRSPTVRRVTRRFLFGPGALEEVVAAGAELIDSAPTRTVGAFYPALMAHDQDAALPNLRGTPTLILVGDSDHLTPPAHSLRMAAALPEAELVQVPDSGHLLLMERPAVVSSHLLRLVERVAAGSVPQAPS